MYINESRIWNVSCFTLVWGVTPRSSLAMIWTFYLCLLWFLLYNIPCVIYFNPKTNSRWQRCSLILHKFMAFFFMGFVSNNSWWEVMVDMRVPTNLNATPFVNTHHLWSCSRVMSAMEMSTTNINKRPLRFGECYAWYCSCVVLLQVMARLSCATPLSILQQGCKVNES